MANKKRQAIKANNKEKLANGVKNEKTKTKAKLQTVENESDEEVNASQDTQNGGSTAEENVTATASLEEPRISRKRRAAVEDQPKPSTSKAKKQRVGIEIPKINSITGKLFVVGDNMSCQLGFEEDITEKKKPTLLDLPYSIVDIAAGAMHSVCLTANGEVVTFGCNDEGALGRITEEGTEFAAQKVDLPERIVQVSAGDSHSAALSESGRVYVWGNFRNKTGSMGLITEGAKQCTPVRILNNITIVKIASGCDHLACLSQSGVVYTCGNGEAGQLGRVSEHSSDLGGRKGIALLLTPDKVPIARSVAAKNIWTGSYSTFVKVQNGSIYAFGLNNYEQLGLEEPSLHATLDLNDQIESPKPIYKPKEVTSFANRTWLQINGGLNHTLALDDKGLVYSLGRSEYGLLGLGERCGDKSMPTAIPSLQDENCVDISCGNSVSFAVTDTGSAFSWGFGTNHQLGHGDDSDQHIPKLIEGNFFNSWKAIKIAGGGQHTLILAQPRKTLEKENKST